MAFPRPMVRGVIFLEDPGTILKCTVIISFDGSCYVCWLNILKSAGDRVLPKETVIGQLYFLFILTFNLLLQFPFIPNDFCNFYRKINIYAFRIISFSGIIRLLKKQTINGVTRRKITVNNIYIGNAHYWHPLCVIFIARQYNSESLRQGEFILTLAIVGTQLWQPTVPKST